MYIDGSNFKDEFGRTLMLRGVNLGGSSKVPYQPDGSTYISEDFYNHRDVSFVGRPFPLVEAEEHFSRLKSWGFNFLRFLVTWEAIEHDGPGIYDHGYLEYIRAVVEKAAEYDINMFIDPHQDVWSRFSGGDGAPGWTFEMVGMDITKFHETGAAFTHQSHGDPLPQMIWSTNATKLAAATMFTLFFGGTDFAPHTKVDGEFADEFLQRHYFNSMALLAKNLVGLTNVVGFDSMNEPVKGWIGLKDLNQRYTTVEKGFIPTPFQAMQLGSGIPLKMKKWERGIFGARIVGRKVINPRGINVWKDGYDPIWQHNGVWRLIKNKPVLLQPNHFGYRRGQTIDFNRDYYVPFNNKFAAALRIAQPRLIIFVEKGFGIDGPAWGSDDASDVVYAPHWYDPVVLVMKRFNSWLNYDRKKGKLVLGARKIKRSFEEQLARPKKHAKEKMGNMPVLIGEVGIAYDLNHKSAYKNGDFSAQIRVFDRTLTALEDNLHHYTLWNYTADNSNSRGDKWNDEDLSIFSRDQMDDPGDINSGGRALEAVVRPYPMATAGEPVQVSFSQKSKMFVLRFNHFQNLEAATRVFIPRFQYPDGYQVVISDGEYEILESEQTLIYRHSNNQREHKVLIIPK